MEAALPKEKLRLGGKYLAFSLENEEFGIKITKIREIIGLMDTRPIPKTPEYIRGVINLRGKIIPVIDLRAKFNMPVTEDTDRTCIIVTELGQGKKETHTGLVVDRVKEVANIGDEEIEPCPSFGTEDVDSSYILGMAKTDQGVKILLDMDRVLSAEDFGFLTQGLG